MLPRHIDTLQTVRKVLTVSGLPLNFGIAHCHYAKCTNYMMSSFITDMTLAWNINNNSTFFVDCFSRHDSQYSMMRDKSKSWTTFPHVAPSTRKLYFFG